MAVKPTGNVHLDGQTIRLTDFSQELKDAFKQTFDQARILEQGNSHFSFVEKDKKQSCHCKLKSPEEAKRFYDEFYAFLKSQGYDPQYNNLNGDWSTMFGLYDED